MCENMPTGPRSQNRDLMAELATSLEERIAATRLRRASVVPLPSPEVVLSPVSRSPLPADWRARGR